MTTTTAGVAAEKGNKSAAGAAACSGTLCSGAGSAVLAGVPPSSISAASSDMTRYGTGARVWPSPVSRRRFAGVEMSSDRLGDRWCRPRARRYNAHSSARSRSLLRARGGRAGTPPRPQLRRSRACSAPESASP